MTEILFKIGVLTGISALLLATLYALPDAQPLPDGLSDGLLWLFHQIYFFDPIFDVPTFFDVMYFALIAIATYLTLLMIRTIVLTVLKIV